MAELLRLHTILRWPHGWLLLLFLPCFSIAQIPASTPVTTLATTISNPVSATSFLSNFANIDLVDQSGHAFEPAALNGKVVLFSFIYTHCISTCPLQTRVLAQVLQDLPADVRAQVRFVSVSIDPATDTPALLQQFAVQMQADLDGWLFLTGSLQHIEQLTRRLHLVDGSDSSQTTGPQLHRTSLWLMDKDGRMLQRYQGDPPDQERLIRELGQVSRMPARP